MIFQQLHTDVVRSRLLTRATVDLAHLINLARRKTWLADLAAIAGDPSDDLPTEKDGKEDGGENRHISPRGYFQVGTGASCM